MRGDVWQVRDANQRLKEKQKELALAEEERQSMDDLYVKKWDGCFGELRTGEVLVKRGQKWVQF